MNRQTVKTLENRLEIAGATLDSSRTSMFAAISRLKIVSSEITARDAQQCIDKFEAAKAEYGSIQTSIEEARLLWARG